jgi:hypothetical protein
VGEGERVVQREQDLEHVYFDTADADLLRHRMTLRRRWGGTDGGWQVKVPSGKARAEIRIDDASGEQASGRLADVVAGVTRGRELHPVARLQTHRCTHRPLDPGCSSRWTTTLSGRTATSAGQPGVVKEPHRVNRYGWVAGGMVLAVVVIVCLKKFASLDHATIWLEASMITLFAIFWVIQTHELWGSGLRSTSPPVVPGGAPVGPADLTDKTATTPVTTPAPSGRSV